MSMEEELQKWAEILTALEEGRHVAHLHKRAEELTEEAADIQQKLLLATSSSARLEFYRRSSALSQFARGVGFRRVCKHPCAMYRVEAVLSRLARRTAIEVVLPVILRSRA